MEASDILGADDLGMTLLPADDEGIEPEADLEAAEAALLDDTAEAEDPEDPDGAESPQAIGMSWVFDFNGHPPDFVLQGSDAAEAHGELAVRQWCLMALYCARYQSPVFSEDFGIDDPEEPFGWATSEDLLVGFEQKIREALLQHDRISAVENFELSADPQNGVLTIERFEVIMDDDTLLAIGGIGLNLQGTT